MKQVKQLIAVTLLLLAVGIPVYAGDMGTPGPPPAASTMNPGNVGTTEQSATDNPISATSVTTEELALDLLLSVLSLF